MRQILIYILVQRPFAFWEREPRTGVPGVGLTWILLAAFVIWLAVQFIVNKGLSKEARQSLYTWGGAILASMFVFPLVGPASLPIFGYGMMVLIGFLSGLWLSRLRAKRIGLDPEILNDLSLWLLVSGISGARLGYIAQYWRAVYARCTSPWSYLVTTINLTDGGLVLIGGLFLGAIGFFAFCRLHRLKSMLIVDVIMPGVFMGIGFGRIGCLLNGCCFGDPCNLPWAIQFPKGSVPWLDLAQRSILKPDANNVLPNFTMPLHPTQVYSAIDGFTICTILWNLFPLRTRNGQLFAFGCMIYSITRFLIEIIRNDELAQFGTGLTISQLYSIGIFLVGLTTLLWLRKQGDPATQSLATDSASERPS